MLEIRKVGKLTVAEADATGAEFSLPMIAEWVARTPGRSAGLSWGETRKLRLRSSERTLILAAGDLVMFGLGLVAYLAVRPEVQFTFGYLARYWYWFAALVISWLVAVAITDGWDLTKAARFSRSQWAAGATVLVASMIFYCIPVMTPGLPGHRSELWVMPCTAFLLLSIWRLVVVSTFAAHGLLHRALVIGAGAAGATVIEELTELCGPSDPPGRSAGHWIMGFVDDDPAKQNQLVHGVPVHGTGDDLVSLAKAFEVDQLVLAITDMHTIRPPLFQAILTCREQGVQVTTMTRFLEELTDRVPVEHAGTNLGVVMPMDSPVAPVLFKLTKRLVDIVLGVVGCALTGALVPFLWLANQLTSPGPLFYRQQRVGCRGTPFQLLKFRSMVVDAEERTGGAVWASPNDARITPVGRFLRQTRLDELPQFWNVLRGHMSLIGPRPERPEFVGRLARSIPFYRIRHAVKPGITGWAQVRYRYGASEDDALKKLQYDLYYIKHQSVFLDWRILLLTVMVVLGFRGR
jgi:exopolysaccharide biosynthesis polyprenyl glycosylphosphotransferase